MRLVTLAITLALVGLVTVPTAAQRSAPASRGAKDLFLDASGATPPPGAGPAAPQYMGLSFWVELLDSSGRFLRVTTDHPFRAGDRIRLTVQSNRDGYLTVLNVGSTGRVTPLFPSAAEGHGAPVRAAQLYQVPANAFLRFDSNPGEETLILMLSPTPPGGGPMPSPSPPPVATTPAPIAATSPPVIGVPPPVAATPPPSVAAPPPPIASAPVTAPAPSDSPSGAWTPTAPPSSFPTPDASVPPAASPPTSPADGAFRAPAPSRSDAAAQQMMSAATKGAMELMTKLLRTAMTRGAKDLVVEVDRTSPQPASYAVAPVGSLADGGMIAIQVKLRHH